MRDPNGNISPWFNSDDADSETATLRQQAHETFDWLIRAFGWAVGDEDPDPNAMRSVRKLRGIFHLGQLRAVLNISSDLKHVLFEAPLDSPLLSGGEKRRYLIQYLDDEMLRDLNETVAYFFQIADHAGEPPDYHILTDFLAAWKGNLHAAASPNIRRPSTPSHTSALVRWERELLDIGNSFESALAGAEFAASAQLSAAEAAVARDAANRAAAKTGALVMGSHFWQIAQDEAKKAWWWTLTTFGLVISVIGVSVWIISKTISAQAVETLIHLIVALPIVGAATYASKIARHHRLLARWAKTASVQINTVEAFSKQLSTPANRDKLILELGRNVFATPIYGDDVKGEHLSAVPNEVLDSFREIAHKLAQRSS
ncbi:hypothetical protein [Mycobacterium sp. Aquia_213]|uniref:hypothetical protein n=1 Tax=Mycobacterium sp. Aquia_213 TaxID=2991728 RepID=UPI00226F50A4|nr:hypothetical protein [Mycobacterium sp. Aquia_213]WAC93568.1 hypothetical protein LMQ14_10770 [Mycobacterium sp. Aquia_213]